LIALYCNEDISVEFSIILKKAAYLLSYGEYNMVVQISEVADFVLDSGYAPSGAEIELCRGKLNSVHFSYYHPPSVDYSFSQEVKFNQTNFGFIKALLNSTPDRQNFFASVNATEDAMFILRHSFSDTAPKASDPTIWVPEVFNTSITIQIEPVEYH
jgi:hypothetical protein